MTAQRGFIEGYFLPYLTYRAARVRVILSAAGAKDPLSAPPSA
jgi:hypothetical protein